VAKISVSWGSVAVIEQHALFRGVHAGHRGEQGRDLGTAAQEIADRPGNLEVANEAVATW
jgi:hypothetical protein